MDIIVDEYVVNKQGEVGTLTAFDGQYITVDYMDRRAMYQSDGFEKGHIRYLNDDLQGGLLAQIAQEKLEAEQKATDARIAEEPAKLLQEASATKAAAPSDAITVESSILLIDPAPAYLNTVAKGDRQLVQEIFAECEKDTQNLYAAFRPKMVYPKFTSRSRSKYCTGFLTKYKDAYVFRVFSRNDVYKRRVSAGITVLESNTAEVLRVLQVNGSLYHFSKNISFSLGYYNNTTANAKWCGSEMGSNVFLNEVICNCDCGYLNGHISDEKVNVEAFLFINLLFPALVNNKVEIAFKNKAFTSTYRIRNLTDYFEGFTSKQIDFASKNNVLHTLPFIKQYGISDIALLRNLEGVMRCRKSTSAYDTLLRKLANLGCDAADVDKRLMSFIKRVEYFNPSVYYDYLNELQYVPPQALTIQDYFDTNYIERHNAMHHQRLLRYETTNLEALKKDEEEYRKAAKELSWINREENGYFIIVPKTVAEFKIEGDVQHNCVYGAGYYRRVIRGDSIIVFLREEKCTPYVTIEFDYRTFEVHQALKKHNRGIAPELYQYIVNLGKRLYYEKHTQR